ncbi:hypothetical protein ACH5RR_008874 [Cinchona calisaya]|uniref:Uncharacterized protein n=1 Tax=Cinchona calisaya TaxID=153742 RepID=A0ABD3AFK9_9GENT
MLFCVGDGEVVAKVPRGSREATLGIDVGLVVEVDCYDGNFGVVGKLSNLIHHDEIVEDGIDHDLILHDGIGVEVVDFGIGGLG